MIKDVTKLESVQRSFSKFACLRCSVPFTSYQDRLNKLNLHTLEYRQTVFDLIFFFKVLHGLTALNFSDYFKIRTLPYPLRGGGHKIEPKEHFKLSQLKNSFFNRVPPIWNALPDKITSEKNINKFKDLLNKFDLYKIVNFKIR